MQVRQTHGSGGPLDEKPKDELLAMKDDFIARQAAEGKQPGLMLMQVGVANGPCTTEDAPMRQAYVAQPASLASRRPRVRAGCINQAGSRTACGCPR